MWDTVYHVLIGTAGIADSKDGLFTGIVGQMMWETVH